MNDDRDKRRREWWHRQKTPPPLNPSNHRRKAGHDYRSTCIYMITLVVKDRSPLLGTLRASDSNHSEPWVEFTALGHEVLKLWQGIPNYHPEIKMLRLCIMPDHIHGILHVTQPLSCHLGNVINGFKKGCNDITRETLGEVLWEPDYHDRILSGKGQLDAMFQYIGDNPRRLWIKRTTPEFFTVHRDIAVGKRRLAVAGNTFLLNYPLKTAVICSRSMSNDDIDRAIYQHLVLAQRGYVFVSPCISPGEKRIMRAVFDAGFPQIVLLENGFSKMWKPSGAQFDACHRGQLLLVAPWEHHSQRTTITREQCLELNAIAQEIAAMLTLD